MPHAAKPESEAALRVRALEAILTEKGLIDPKALDKVRFYLEHGVRLVWLIDPRTRIVLVWSTWGTPEQVAEDGVLDGRDVLPGFSTPVRDILPPLDLGEQTADS